MKRILIPVDFSPVTGKQFDALRMLSSKDAKLDVTLLHVGSKNSDLNLKIQQAESQLKERIQGAETTIRTQVLQGKPAEIILAEIEENRPDLVIAGTQRHGITHEFILGSVARKLMQKSHAPLLMVSTKTLIGRHRLKNLLVPIDFSKRSNHAIEIAAKLSQTYDCKVNLIHVCMSGSKRGGGTIPLEAVDALRLAAEFKLLDVQRNMKCNPDRVVSNVRFGRPAEAIKSAAAFHATDWIILASQGHGPAFDLFVGSVTHALMRKAARPLLIVTPSCKVTHFSQSNTAEVSA